MDEIESAVDVGCFGIIPEELWLHVLDKLMDSEDILNVLRAFPELEKPAQKKKAYWLFDQVLPQLMTKHLVIMKNDVIGNYVDSKELLNLRLVSKRWKRVVETSIENHADRRPFCSESANGNRRIAAVGLPENHFNFYPITKYPLGATVFHTVEQMTKFQHEMASCQGNPFPGKFVIFEIGDNFDGDWQAFVKKGMELLQKFGKHVLILHMEVADDNTECNLKMYKEILKGLSSVPNLKSLKIWGYLYSQNKATLEFFSQKENLDLFPKLTNLESFECQVDVEGACMPNWTKYLIYLYGGRGRELSGLRKVALDVDYVNAVVADNFKNLKELHLLLYDEEYDFDDVRNVLGMFPKGQLKKFGLSGYPFVVVENQKIYIDELVGMLSEFQIENVTVEKLNLHVKGIELDAKGITSLHVDDCKGLSYDFLEGLPDLTFLTVHVCSDRAEVLFRENNLGEAEKTLAHFIYDCLCNADMGLKWKGGEDIWQKLKKLKMINCSVVIGYRVHDIQFVREYGNKQFWGWTGGKYGEINRDEDEKKRTFGEQND